MEISARVPEWKTAVWSSLRGFSNHDLYQGVNLRTRAVALVRGQRIPG